MKLNHKIYGQGDPIIILHGLFGMLDNWKTIAGKLADQYTVILVDQRNHGRSPHEDALTYPLMAADLQAFMEDNWIHTAHIMGHSMGGKTAMQFAVDYPEMVEKLIVVDMGIKQYPPGHEIIFKALNAVPIDQVESRSDAEEAIAQYVDDKGVRLFLMKNLTRNKEAGYEWKMNLPVIEKHYEDILAEISIPQPVDVESLFIYGTKSGYVTKEDIESIKEKFPEARFDGIESGHWVHAEKPKELLSSVEGFLSE